MTKITKTLLLSLATLAMIFGGCNNTPKTDTARIEQLRKQLLTDAQTLNEIESKDFVALEKDFMRCDSMLQYQSQEQVEKSFETLRLVQAYLEQFKATSPLMHAELDSTLLQLDRLKADIETDYLPDSLKVAYIENETEYVDRLTNQVSYFKDRFEACQKDLNALKKQK